VGEDFRPEPSTAITARMPKVSMPAVPLPETYEASENEGEYAGMPEKELRAVQNGFIILTHDNNFPDPFGVFSTTKGQRTWKEVADMFRAKFKIRRAEKTMPKRYREYIHTYRLQNPTYPTKITYVGGPLPENFSKRESIKRAAPDALSTGNALVVQKKRRVDEPVSQPPMIALAISNANGAPLGIVPVPHNDLLMSSNFYRREWKSFTMVNGMDVMSTSLAVAERYVLCISPRRLSKLPQFDFKLINRHSRKTRIMGRHLHADRVDF
jgi:hypothetical protein